MTLPDDHFYPPDLAAWTAWLEANHHTAEVVHLVFYKKGAGRPTLAYDAAVREAICFGWIDGLKRRIDDERYSFRFTPRRPGSKWSPSNKRRVAELEAAGRLRPSGAATIAEARASGAWDQPGAPVVPDSPPTELTAALDGSPAARAAFDALAPSHKRQWLMWIADAKRAATRERRSAKMVAILEAGGKTPG